MKNFILAAAFQLLAIISTTALASSYSITELYNNGKYYGGLNYVKTEYDIRDAQQRLNKENSVDESVGAGMSGHIGFETLANKNWMVGVEVEAKKYEGRRLKTKTGTNLTVVSAHGVGGNLKADYYLNDEFYVGAKVGVEHITMKAEATDAGTINKFRSKDTVLTYGVQVGYHIRTDLTAKVEFRRGKFSDRQTDFDTDIESLMVGFEFKI
ncbi:hypothetical protein CS022_19925 [Veronia nyctiphanis]|uniref:Outer membrane protein beta-barrel domain-containing protein n=1 Tax=Veronia nyctiphanis TaxID=1278244 RepID=A0A4V1LSH5_9GAMM|nr:outer membrane beta-barrel protein [Veronia nyctiphanis]RXJ71718.1 hypothetical protein CS022_19925 [Veronia nyctiphanis]